MNVKFGVTRLWERDGAATRSEEDLAMAAPCRGLLEEELDRLKDQLLTPMVLSLNNSALAQELRWVANEAAALAWTTVCPLLVLPTLLEEKLHGAVSRWERQQRMRPERTH